MYAGIRHGGTDVSGLTSQKHDGTCDILRVNVFSDISSIDHLGLREFVSGPPRYHLAIKGVREQFVIVEQNSGP